MLRAKASAMGERMAFMPQMKRIDFGILAGSSSATAIASATPVENADQGEEAPRGGEVDGDLAGQAGGQHRRRRRHLDHPHGIARRRLGDDGAGDARHHRPAGGEVRLTKVRPELIQALLDKLEQAGAEVVAGNDHVTIKRNGARLKAVDVETDPYPGFATDLQAQFMALMTLADGESVIRETIFENRFMHVPELGRLGADISVHGGEARVSGVASLEGAEVMATDLRASVSLVIAGLAARGETVVSRVYHLDRGFERLEEKLGACGAQVRRIKGDGGSED